jgi:hypothetical protein
MDSGRETQLSKRRAPASGSFGASLEWPTLLDRALEDFERVARLDIQLLEAKLARLLIETIDRSIVHLLGLFIGMLGGSCLLAALLCLLHDWMPWWECFAILGGTISCCALAMYILLKTPASRAES